MDNDTRSWLVGVPFATESAPPPGERPALSTSQKRELASFTGLVMASTVFFLTPLLVPSSQVAQAPQLADPPLATPPAIAAEPTTPVSVGAAAPVRRGRPISAARRAAPLTPERAPGAVASVRAAAAAKAAPKKSAPDRRRGISGGLIRVLVGSGRYRVQPFPTPSSGD